MMLDVFSTRQTLQTGGGQGYDRVGVGLFAASVIKGRLDAPTNNWVDTLNPEPGLESVLGFRTP